MKIEVPEVEHVHLLSDQNVTIAVSLSVPAFVAMQQDWVPVSAVRLHCVSRERGLYEFHVRTPEADNLAEEKPPAAKGAVIVQTKDSVKPA